MECILTAFTQKEAQSPKWPSESLQGAHLLPSLPYGTHGKGGSLWNCKIADPFGMPAPLGGHQLCDWKGP